MATTPKVMETGAPGSGSPEALEAKIQDFQNTASGALQRALREQKILRDALMGLKPPKPFAFHKS